MMRETNSFPLHPGGLHGSNDTESAANPERRRTEDTRIVDHIAQSPPAGNSTSQDSSGVCRKILDQGDCVPRGGSNA